MIITSGSGLGFLTDLMMSAVILAAISIGIAAVALGMIADVRRRLLTGVQIPPPPPPPGLEFPAWVNPQHERPAA